MADKAADYYTTEGLVSETTSTTNAKVRQPEDYRLVEKIEVVVKSLGTMVVEPEFELSSTTLKKVQVGSVQRPILEGDDRTKVKAKLVELISKL